MNTTEFDIPENAEGVLINQYEKKGSTLLFSIWGYNENTSYITMKIMDNMEMEYGKYYITNVAVYTSAEKLAGFMKYNSGYRKNEITSLILGPNTVMVVLGMILAVPLTIIISAAMFYYSVSDIGVYFLHDGTYYGSQRRSADVKLLLTDIFEFPVISDMIKHIVAMK